MIHTRFDRDSNTNTNTTTKEVKGRTGGPLCLCIEKETPETTTTRTVAVEDEAQIKQAEKQRRLELGLIERREASLKQEKQDFEQYMLQQKKILKEQKTEWQNKMEQERLEWQNKMEQEREDLCQQQEQVIELKHLVTEDKKSLRLIKLQLNQEKRKVAQLLVDNIRHSEELGASEIKLSRRWKESEEDIQKVNQELTTINNTITQRNYHLAGLGSFIKETEEKLKKNWAMLLQREHLLSEQDKQKEKMLEVIQKLQYEIQQLQQQIRYHNQQITNQEKIIQQGGRKCIIPYVIQGRRCQLTIAF